MKWLHIALIWFIYLPIVGLTYLIVWLDRKLQFKLPFPRHLQQLAEQKDWLVQRLKENKILPAEAVVTGYNVKPLNQDLIFRSNAGFIELTYTHNNTEHYLKCFAKFAPIAGTVWNRTIFNLQLNHTKESDFNKLFVAENPTIPSPKVYYSAVSPLTGNLCLITEFMQDCVEHKDSIYEDFTEEHLTQAIKGLATLHALHWKDTSEKMKKIMRIEDSTLLLFDSIMSFSWSNHTRKVMFQSWKYTNDFQTLLHGDARIGNMMFANGSKGRFVFFDWQAVRKGRAVYDLAYFLILSLNNEHRQKAEQVCLQQYYEFLLQAGVTDYSFAELEIDYKHATICLLALLSLPLLSGEASAEGDGVIIFAWGMNVWRKRLAAKFNDFDYQWMSVNYNLSEADCKKAINEMLGTIQNRLLKLSGTTDLEAYNPVY
ncbi:MAG: oxidoreductase family protein [Chitinophagales bacterium]